jgi:peptidoglycan/LPS O-acetylase OafA/YrhL
MPFMIVIALRSTLWLTLFVIVTIAISETNFFVIHFFWGILIAKYHYRLIALGSKMHWLLKIPLFGIGILLLSSTNRPLSELSQLSWVLSGLGAALLLALFTCSDLAKRILEVGVLRFVGRISYSMYLLHGMVLITITPLLIKLLNYSGIAGLAAYWLVMVPTIGIVLLISWLSFLFIEQPSVRMGRFVSQKYVALNSKNPRFS